MPDVIRTAYPHEEFDPKGAALRVHNGEKGELIHVDSVQEFLASRAPRFTEVGPAGNLLPGNQPSFLLRVDLNPQASIHGPSAGMVSLWQFGATPSMAAISLVFECAGDKCNGLLTLETSDKVGNRTCPKCHHTWDQDDLCGFVIYAGDMDFWGDLAARLYDRVGGLAEILLMRRRQSIIKLTHAVISGEKNAEELYLKGRAGDPDVSIEGAYYTMAAIHKDIAAGSGLGNRIKAFIRGG